MSLSGGMVDTSPVDLNVGPVIYATFVKLKATANSTRFSGLDRPGTRAYGPNLGKPVPPFVIFP